MSKKDKLPKGILGENVKKCGLEFGCSQFDFITVGELAVRERIAIIGGKIQYELPDGTCELYWLSYDPKSAIGKACRPLRLLSRWTVKRAAMLAFSNKWHG